MAAPPAKRGAAGGPRAALEAAPERVVLLVLDEICEEHTSAALLYYLPCDRFEPLRAYLAHDVTLSGGPDAAAVGEESAKMLSGALADTDDADDADAWVWTYLARWGRDVRALVGTVCIITEIVGSAYQPYMIL